jgi:hypothetical protein
MILSTNANLWVVAGIVYALAGAALLCNSVFLSPAPGRSAGASDAAARRRLTEQWLDARIGAVLVVAGFFLQATGALGSETLRVPAAFVLLGLALGAVYYGLMKSLLVENLMDAVEPQKSDRALSLVASSTPDPGPAAPIERSEPVEVPAMPSAVQA